MNRVSPLSTRAAFGWFLIACQGDSLELDSGSASVQTDERWAPLQRTPAWESSDGGFGTGLGLADVDGDGDLDVVVAIGNDMRPGPLVVYENGKSGIEELPGFKTIRERFHGHLSLGDLNGDGWVDAAVSVYLGDSGWGEPGGVDLYLNEGGRLPDSPSQSIDGLYTFSNALGDLDLDGDLDLAIAVGEPYTGESGVAVVHMNDGSGHFDPHPGWSAQVERVTMDVAFVDLNADGLLDLAMANHGHAHSVYAGHGGTLGEQPYWLAPGDAYEGNTLDWGDVNRDGFIDLVISDNGQMTGDGRIRIYCGPDLDVCWQNEDEPMMQSGVSLEDVDGDGLLELAAGAWLGHLGNSWGSWGANIRLYDHDGGKGLHTYPAWTSHSGDVVTEALAWGDLDGSGWVEQAVEGVGLVPLESRPRMVTVEGGVAGDGYISGPGKVTARYLVSESRDLVVTDWNQENGNLIFSRSAE